MAGTLGRRTLLGGAIGALGLGAMGSLSLPQADPYRPRAALPDGRLSVADTAAGTYEFGRHRLELTPSRWSVADDDGRIWWWIDGAPLAALQQRVVWSEHLGHHTVDEARREHPHVQVDRVDTDPAVARVRGTVGPWAFTLTLTSTREASLAGLRVQLVVPGADAVVFRTALAAQEGVFGLGTQTLTDLRGHVVPVVSREQGVGRGRQPLTVLAELTRGAGGAPTSTYTAIARATTGERSFDLRTHAVSVWDARRGLAVASWQDHLDLRIRAEASPGPLPSPPGRGEGLDGGAVEWSLPGAIIGAQGGREVVERKRQRLLDAGAEISALWVQDWPGQRTTDFGDRVWWLWQVDEQRYPDMAGWTRRLAADDTQLLLYVNPFVVDAAEREGWQGRNLYAEARDAGYLVRNRRGEPYALDQDGFHAGLIDLSDPQAGAWFRAQIRAEYLRLGASGGMADFAEGPPFDAVLAGGAASELHNAWPMLWSRYQPGGWSFQRAAASHGPKGDDRPTMMWAGDQITTWDRHDGMASAIAAICNAGVSGQPLMHSDIGGYTGLREPVVGVRRTPELLLRWAEWSMFSPAFRTHEGNQPDRFAQPWDGEVVEEFARMTRRFHALRDYRKAVVDRALDDGWPAMSPVWLQHPHTWASRAAGRTASYFFGGFLVTPVLRPGARSVRVTLPPGRWRHVWSGREYAGDRLVEVDAPLGRPAAFHPVDDEQAAQAADAVARTE